MSGYLKIVGVPRQMGGVGAPKPTIFGVLGHTKYDPYQKSLGGLVMEKSKTKARNPTESVKSEHSDHHMETAGHATAVSKQHYGQVPYAGKYMKAEGSRV